MDKVLSNLMTLLAIILIGSVCLIVYTGFNLQWHNTKLIMNLPNDKNESSSVSSKNNMLTDLHPDEDVELVKRHCLSCHSAALITQTKLSEQGWRNNIVWMQQTQGLWDLGKDHERVIAYLTRNYGEYIGGRRENLEVDQIQWYYLTEAN